MPGTSASVLAAVQGAEQKNQYHNQQRLRGEGTENVGRVDKVEER